MKHEVDEGLRSSRGLLWEVDGRPLPQSAKVPQAGLWVPDEKGSRKSRLAACSVHGGYAKLCTRGLHRLLDSRVLPASVAAEENYTRLHIA